MHCSARPSMRVHQAACRAHPAMACCAGQTVLLQVDPALCCPPRGLGVGCLGGGSCLTCWLTVELAGQALAQGANQGCAVLSCQGARQMESLPRARGRDSHMHPSLGTPIGTRCTPAYAAHVAGSDMLTPRMFGRLAGMRGGGARPGAAGCNAVGLPEGKAIPWSARGAVYTSQPQGRAPFHLWVRVLFRGICAAVEAWQCRPRQGAVLATSVCSARAQARARASAWHT